ncbi:hypothetical protein OROMI_004200 [Orobanche minor]
MQIPPLSLCPTQLRHRMIHFRYPAGGIWMPEYKEEGGFLFKAVEETHPP